MIGQQGGPGTDTGHGHVWARPDGTKARCGGPRICAKCALDENQYRPSSVAPAEFALSEAGGQEIAHNIGVSMAGGNSSKRQEDDFYPTPPEVTQALIETGLIPDVPIWEPACGNGAMARVLEAGGWTVEASDLHDRGYGAGGVDFLRTRLPRGPAIVTNPPFDISKDFIIRAAHWPHIAWMALVVKSSYWNVADRLALFEQTRPAWWLPLTWRVDFLNLGRPTMDVAWCVWDWRGDWRRRVGCMTRPLPRPGRARATADLFSEGRS